MKFSEFNNETNDDLYGHDEPQQKLPIREDMSMPRNPPLFSDQYGHRQTSSPLYFNPYEKSAPSLRNPLENEYNQYRVSTTAPTHFPSYNPSNQSPLSLPSGVGAMNRSAIQSPNFYLPQQQSLKMHNNNQVTELFTFDKPSHSETPSNHQPLTSDQPVSCLDVNDHIVSCPICSNYYKSYSYLYIGIIIILLIIILFLFKSLTEKR